MANTTAQSRLIRQNLLKLKIVLSYRRKEIGDMYFLTKLTAVGLLMTITAVISPTFAEELPQNLGPVGPNEPILTDVGTKRVLAWYKPDGDGCAVSAIVYNRSDIDGNSTAGIRIRLNRGQIVHFNSTYNVKSLNLQCADDASALRVVDAEELVVFDIERTKSSITASTSGY